jgi:hypothetical protein
VTGEGPSCLAQKSCWTKSTGLAPSQRLQYVSPRATPEKPVDRVLGQGAGGAWGMDRAAKTPSSLLTSRAAQQEKSWLGTAQRGRSVHLPDGPSRR